jgi:hypothetical protein
MIDDLKELNEFSFILTKEKLIQPINMQFNLTYLEQEYFLGVKFCH